MNKRNIKKRNKTHSQQYQWQEIIYAKLVLNQNKVLGTKRLTTAETVRCKRQHKKQQQNSNNNNLV